jgi:hypothetical protein
MIGGPCFDVHERRAGQHLVVERDPAATAGDERNVACITAMPARISRIRAGGT